MIILVFVMLIGLCVGSFLNVCICRIPKEESISIPASHCRNCGHKLRIYDLVPVLSYAVLKRKCRYCKTNISIQYPLVEITNTVLYLILYIKFGLTMEFFKYIMLVSVLLVIGIIDFQTKYIYMVTIGFALILGIIFFCINWVKTGTSPQNNILGVIIGFGIVYLIEKITGGMGEGDKAISAICGLFLGAKLILVAVILSILTGGIVALIILALKLKDSKGEIAFGPYLAIGTILAIFIGDSTIGWYMTFY